MSSSAPGRERFSAFRGGLALAGLNTNALMTASQAALYTGRTVAAVCNWVARGHLAPATDRHGSVLRDSRRRVLYRLLDVARAEATDGRRIAA